ncbi:MAG: alcohol dehydrogenase catalytic domain-containing protein [Clostridia bacterium]|nr:alcohol dehydrogenase catalytic domain-containing protein [Clostridia bacterium]
MKKLLMKGPKQSYLAEVDEPIISKPNQVKIRLKYCGVCMSEHYNWSTAKEGMTFGHEPVGVIVEIGEGVTRFKIGDRVSGAFGGQAQYVLAAESDVYKLPDNVSDEEGILEPLACLISAVSKVRMTHIGQRAAVVGCGYMGCGAISLLKKRGFYVVATDIRPESVANALKYGADEAYLVEDLPAKSFFILGSGLNFDGEPGGFPLVMEWGETNESLDLAIRMTAQCGQLAIGAYHTGEKRLVDMQMLNVKAIDCLSTHPRERDLMRKCYNSAVQMLGAENWNYKHVPTKVYPVSMFDQAHENLETKFGKYLKAVVDFTRDDFEPYIIE